MMLLLDEADAIAPQRPQKGEERMLGAAEDIVRRGGQRGIGCTLISQRSAVLNKNVLTQIQVLVALRTISPQDLAALDAWVEVHGTARQRATLMESLPSLPVGDAWFWSPGWPRDDGIFKRIHVSPIETFDSGATPKPGEQRREPKAVADVDLDALRRQMAATIERAKADDPRELRRRIADLEAKLSKAAAAPAAKTVTKTREVSVFRAADLEKLSAHLAALGKVADKINAATAEISATARAAAATRESSAQSYLPGLLRAGANRKNVIPRAAAPRVKLGEGLQRPTTSTAAAAEISNPQRRMLGALAWLEAIGVAIADKNQLATLSGQRPSGGFRNNLSVLKTAGLIRYPSDGQAQLTIEGRAVADPGDVPRTPEEIQAQVMAKISGPQQRILAALIGAYPDAVEKTELARRADQQPSGGFRNNLSELRTMGVIDYPGPGAAVALPVLFLEGGR